MSSDRKSKDALPMVRSASPTNVFPFLSDTFELSFLASIAIGVS